MSIGPSDLLLSLGAPSAGATDTVVWDVIRRHTRSRNTCFVKSGRLPVHLGLDHAESGANKRSFYEMSKSHFVLRRKSARKKAEFAVSELLMCELNPLREVCENYLLTIAFSGTYA